MGFSGSGCWKCVIIDHLFPTGFRYVSGLVGAVLLDVSFSPMGSAVLPVFFGPLDIGGFRQGGTVALLRADFWRMLGFCSYYLGVVGSWWILFF